MNCKNFGICPSCKYNLNYDIQLNQKVDKIKEKFKEFYDKEFDIFPSLPTHFRNRAEFGIYHMGDDIFYTLINHNKDRVFIDECEIVDKKISDILIPLKDYISKNPNLKNKLFGIEFISTNLELVITLLYHKDISPFSDDFKSLRDKFDINLIIRSRGKILRFGNELIKEYLIINNQKFDFVMSDNAFIQPNRFVNEFMISWVKNNIFDCDDYLEMYCGHGNFTIPLADKFNNVFATEISKKSIQMAQKNLEINQISNTKFARISAQDLMDAFANVREFNRLKDIDLSSYNFSHILVDPPRAGLDEKVLNFIKDYKFIIYISCNPNSLYENLKFITKTHKITKFAIFDQFVNTDHIECGVILQKKE